MRISFTINGDAVNCRRAMLRAVSSNRARVIGMSRDRDTHNIELTIDVSKALVQTFGSIEGAVSYFMLNDTSVTCNVVDCSAATA